ncbi:hypothetical protein P171DRAFT_475226 [Karstenula rhodostoma CBS 690.94]|uniref:Uncharacterized protein n=1 Tax=Karstenula rhodostoma CBS 690.94 TaxID=1392251 RepID=A0A9P4UA08_9PLEO|nr:hypothetical protein P171DRAFT_475226 [Karstenula rhodostoma CBS 690.94]
MSNPRGAKHRAHFTLKRDLRPILTSLNGDNSWLLSFPRPEPERKTSGKAYFHIVHDPWLNGPEVQISSWLHEGETGHSPIDAIHLSFHYGDHLHVPTLLTFDPSIPVFTTTDGAPIIRKSNHFTSITAYADLDPTFTGDWSAIRRAPGLPSYITVFRIKGHHELNFFTALLWSPAPDTHEAVLYSPHGLHTSTPALQALLHHADPSFSTLALLHGLKESWTWSWQTTFGAKSGLELYRESRARYWVATHNDRLGYGGVVWWLVTDIFRSVEWALGQEKGGQEVRKDVKVEEVKNGECFVLE